MAAHNSESTEHLKRVLADTFVLYMKTYAVHWNYKGAKFFSVHRLTEEQYGELAEAIDEIAERIRAKGDEAPISLSSVLESADLKEMGKGAGTDQGIQELVAGHELLTRRAKEAIAGMEEENDVYSADMMTRRIGAHDKSAWMLRSFLNQ